MVRSRTGRLLGRTAQTVARTAVIAGTATAVSGAMTRPRAGDTPPANPSATPEAAMDQLQKLAELRESGVLTEEEFAAQKARILA